MPKLKLSELSRLSSRGVGPTTARPKIHGNELQRRKPKPQKSRTGAAALADSALSPAGPPQAASEPAGSAAAAAQAREGPFMPESFRAAVVSPGVPPAEPPAPLPSVVMLGSQQAAAQQAQQAAAWMSQRDPAQQPGHQSQTPTAVSRSQKQELAGGGSRQPPPAPAPQQQALQAVIMSEGPLLTDGALSQPAHAPAPWQQAPQSLPMTQTPHLLQRQPQVQQPRLPQDSQQQEQQAGSVAERQQPASQQGLLHVAKQSAPRAQAAPSNGVLPGVSPGKASLAAATAGREQPQAQQLHDSVSLSGAAAGAGAGPAVTGPGPGSRVAQAAAAAAAAAASPSAGASEPLLRPNDVDAKARLQNRLGCMHHACCLPVKALHHRLHKARDVGIWRVALHREGSARSEKCGVCTRLMPNRQTLYSQPMSAYRSCRGSIPAAQGEAGQVTACVACWASWSAAPDWG